VGEKLELKTKLNPLDALQTAIDPQPTYRDHPMTRQQITRCLRSSII